jgi:hypothetical protein
MYSASMRRTRPARPQAGGRRQTARAEPSSPRRVPESRFRAARPTLPAAGEAATARAESPLSGMRRSVRGAGRASNRTRVGRGRARGMARGPFPGTHQRAFAQARRRRRRPRPSPRRQGASAVARMSPREPMLDPRAASRSRSAGGVKLELRRASRRETTAPSACAPSHGPRVRWETRAPLPHRRPGEGARVGSAQPASLRSSAAANRRLTPPGRVRGSFGGGGSLACR